MQLTYKYVILRLVLLWFFISSVYYIQAIFIGVGALQQGENIYHKLIKYTVCIFLSLSIVYLQRKKYIYLTIILFILLAIASVDFSDKVTIFATTMLIIGTMIGYVYLIPAFFDKMETINYVFLWTGVIVGCISMLELTAFYNVMKPYWVATGGVRSISSLLNPTNSGAYSAIMIILALTMEVKNKFTRLLFILMPLVTLVLSGSRTAWLSLFLVMSLTLFLHDQASQKLRKFIPAMLILGFVSTVFYLSISENFFTEIDSHYRGLNTYTASVRFEHFLTYLNNLNINMLLPDINDRNADLISDNVYLVMLNFFGIIGFFILTMLAVLIYFLNMYNNATEKLIPVEIAIWRIVFIYFIISGLSNSFINSFPVNQLFFISCGYYIYKIKLHRHLKINKENKSAMFEL